MILRVAPVSMIAFVVCDPNLTGMVTIEIGLIIGRLFPLKCIVLEVMLGVKLVSFDFTRFIVIILLSPLGCGRNWGR